MNPSARAAEAKCVVQSYESEVGGIVFARDERRGELERIHRAQAVSSGKVLRAIDCRNRVVHCYPDRRERRDERLGIA
jgi:hypothetical protein